MIEAFASDDAPDLLIVVDKLLTGFDEPINSVLYIDKPLKQHNLIQAIARVNRLHEAKQYGLLIDYRGILKELDTAIKEYQNLETCSQGGYDIDDIEGLYHQVSFEYKRLPKLYDRLWSIFKGVKNRQDLEQYRQILIPKWVKDDNGDLFDDHQKIREDFYEILTEFGICLKIALSSRSFYEDGSFTEADIKNYKNDLHHFINIRKTARHDALETVDYSLYEEQICNLVDRHVVGESFQESQGVYMVTDLGRAEDPKSWGKEKTRNETDIIRSHIKKTIEQDLARDPYAQMVFSEMLKRAIIETEAEMLLSSMDLEEICEAVYSDLDQIEVQELWDRSGKSRYGYVSPEEMAVEMMENELEPHNENVFRCIELEKYTEAKICCMGVLKGIYTYSMESTSEFKDWAVDLPKECFGYLLENWLKKTNNAKDKILMDNFLEEYFPAWYNWAHQIIEKAKKRDQRTISALMKEANLIH